MNHLRRNAAVAATCGALCLSPVPASAQSLNGGGFHGTAHINCFGCGASTGSALLDFSGVVNGMPIAEGAVQASYSVWEDPRLCPAVGSAAGYFTGAVDGTFTWTREGAFAVITTQGEINGVGVALFSTKHVGLVCGDLIDADVAGTVVGT
jgi:hypothetical protein